MTLIIDFLRGGREKPKKGPGASRKFTENKVRAGKVQAKSLSEKNHAASPLSYDIPSFVRAYIRPTRWF